MWYSHLPPYVSQLSGHPIVVQGNGGLGECAVRALGDKRAHARKATPRSKRVDLILRLNGEGLPTSGADRDRHRDSSARDPLAPAQYSSGSPSGNGKEVRLIVLENPLCGVIEPSHALLEYARFAAPARAPQRGSGSSQRSSGSGRSYVGSAGARPLLSESFGRPLRAWCHHARHAHGSPSTGAISTYYDLRARSEAETWGSAARVGHVRRRMGVPHAELVSIGLVVGLDYRKPWLEPYHEFQRSAAHETPPHFHALLPDLDAERLAYGARTLAEGGLQGLPQLHFPGGALIGRPAGLVNTAEIKGGPTRCGFFFTGVVCNSAYTLALSSWTVFYDRFSITCMLVAEAAFCSAAFVSTVSSAMFKPSVPSASSNDSASVFNSFESASESSASDAHPSPRLLRPRTRAVHNVRPGFATRLGLAGGALCRGGHRDVEGAGAVDFGEWASREGGKSLYEFEDLARRARDAPGGGVRADRVLRVRAADEHGVDE
ncbi:hypothetical protein DFH09DRAFT_1482363 [Mycena vulgaris]|nr:hypothetical protein DFH09DRAFT_1083226 [Mycena vulgaris]KAJ6560782.1 hypothetical protein DFH09DRAFT_1482363 [Mycena vulgaris]